MKLLKSIYKGIAKWNSYLFNIFLAPTEMESKALEQRLRIFPYQIWE